MNMDASYMVKSCWLPVTLIFQMLRMIHVIISRPMDYVLSFWRVHTRLTLPLAVTTATPEKRKERATWLCGCQFPFLIIPTKTIVAVLNHSSSSE